MASVKPESASWRQETTFTNYSADQGKVYASHRPTYHSSVFNAVLEHHKSGGGEFETLLDVGCGPGVATAPLAKHFQHAIGVDPSMGMIETAGTKNIISSTGEPVKFEISTAEDMKPIADSSVDLITAFSAAHWFSMPEFWREAARVLKPNGSVALIGSWMFQAHPSMPNATKVQETMDHFWYGVLKPYMAAGNLLLLERFRDLTMPWDVTNPSISAISKEGLFRQEWDSEDKFFDEPDELPLSAMEAIVGTLSPVTRWREAFPDKVGTEDDCVRVLRRQLEKLLHEAGVPHGAETFRGFAPGQVVMVRKSKEDKL